MTNDLPPVRCGDVSTWRHNDEWIHLPGLLQLIEENGGAEGLDLHGANLTGLDARPDALRRHVDRYRKRHGPEAWPPWLSPHAWNLTSINLAGAHLEHANLFGAHMPNAFLSDAHLQHSVVIDAHLETAVLSEARLQHAMLKDAHLERAVLRDADLESASLWSAHLEDANLVGAHLEEAGLWGAHLLNADLWGAHLRGAMWYWAHLDGTRVRREQLGPSIGDEFAARGQSRQFGTFHDAREAYLALKTNFDSIGRYDDAGWAYVKEQQMEKAMCFPTTVGHEWIGQRLGGAVPPPWWGPLHVPAWVWWKARSAFYHVRLFLGVCPRKIRDKTARRDEEGQERDEWLSRRRWARNWAYELLTGYGEWPHMPPIWAVVVVLVFAVIYAAAGNIASGDVGALEGQPTHSPITALVHSISAFATIGFNTLEPQGWGARLLTAIEAMLGIGLFALFVFTLGNRMRRS